MAQPKRNWKITSMYKSSCHPEHSEGSGYIHFMLSDSSLRSEWHDFSNHENPTLHTFPPPPPPRKLPNHRTPIRLSGASEGLHPSRHRYRDEGQSCPLCRVVPMDRCTLSKWWNHEARSRLFGIDLCYLQQSISKGTRTKLRRPTEEGLPESEKREAPRRRPRLLPQRTEKETGHPCGHLLERPEIHSCQRKSRRHHQHPRWGVLEEALAQWRKALNQTLRRFDSNTSAFQAKRLGVLKKSLHVGEKESKRFC